eukprot:SAG22_NODE_4830_length_1155_cov_2.503788_1_plen_277_part_10
MPVPLACLVSHRPKGRHNRGGMPPKRAVLLRQGGTGAPPAGAPAPRRLPAPRSTKVDHRQPAVAKQRSERTVPSSCCGTATSELRARASAPGASTSASAYQDTQQTGTAERAPRRAPAVDVEHAARLHGSTHTADSMSGAASQTWSWKLHVSSRAEAMGGKSQLDSQSHQTLPQSPQQVPPDPAAIGQAGYAAIGAVVAAVLAAVASGGSAQDVATTLLAVAALFALPPSLLALGCLHAVAEPLVMPHRRLRRQPAPEPATALCEEPEPEPQPAMKP